MVGRLSSGMDEVKKNIEPEAPKRESIMSHRYCCVKLSATVATTRPRRYARTKSAPR